jgi:hypothetical protein
MPCGMPPKKKKKKRKMTRMSSTRRISIPDSSEWGTCTNCKRCGLVRNMCSECNEDGMRFERHPKSYFNDEKGVIHIIDITRRIICGEALVSMVIGKLMMRTPETAVENFLHAMATTKSS